MKQKVYEFLKTIPKGKVVTYGQIATYLGNKGYARVVGNILHNNPNPDFYPCYKVVNAKGELAKNFGDIDGIDRKTLKESQKRRLESDGIEVIDYRVNLNKFLWKDS